MGLVSAIFCLCIWSVNLGVELHANGRPDAETVPFLIVSLLFLAYHWP